MGSKAGRMRYRVTWKKENATPDSGGFETETFSTTATTWADIRPMSGKEKFEAAQFRPNATHMITIRHRTDIGEGDVCSASLNGLTRAFRILGITRKPRELPRFLQVEVREDPDLSI